MNEKFKTLVNNKLIVQRYELIVFKKKKKNSHSGTEPPKNEKHCNIGNTSGVK